MLFSMTAFARQEHQSELGQTIWELRSVNHRYLDISFYLPEPLSYLEPILRQQMSSRLQRGRIDVKLRYKPSPAKHSEIGVDESLAHSLLQAFNKLSLITTGTTQPININDLLRWPHLIKIAEKDYSSLQTKLIGLFNEALDKLCQVRAKEGEAIAIVILQRLDQLHTLIQSIKKQLPSILLTQRKKIQSRLDEFQLTLDPNRFEQEMLLFMQKTDVAEEIDRLAIHLHEFRKLLQQDKTSGKQLDFLLQELNREANTLASKALNAELSISAVNLKVLIEEIREQVQNVE